MIEVRLETLMRERGVSVPGLSKQSGVHTSRIYGLLKSPDRVHLATLNQVCAALRVTPCDILVYTPDQETAQHQP